MRAVSELVAIAIALGLGLGCTATRLDYQECTQHSECRALFGFGMVCTTGGLCETGERLNRCSTTFPEDLFSSPEEHADTLVFGNLMDRSLATHRARELSARLAVKQASEGGGLDLRQIGIVFCTIEEDSEFDFLERQDAAEASAEYLIDSLGVPAIIGPASSDDMRHVFQVLRDRGSVFISPSATSPALTDLESTTPSDDNPGLLWRTAPPDSLQGAAIAYDMRAPGVDRTQVVDTVAVVHHVGAYGAALADVFGGEFTADGGSVTLLPFSTDGEMADKIAEAAIGDFDEVLFVSGQTTDAVAFMDSAAGLSGFDSKGIFLTDAAANPDLLMQANPARFAQVRGTRQAPRDQAVDLVYASFLAAYASEYGEDVSQFSFTANSYDAAWLLASGSAWSLFQEGEISGIGIAKGLRRVSSGVDIETRSTEWNKIVQAFRDGNGVDISGASGDLDYDPLTEETSGDIETWRIEDGVIVGIDTWPPAGGG